MLEDFGSPKQPLFAHDAQYLIPVNGYPGTMQDIPASRMFMIRDALKAYKEVHGPQAVTYDASQGDGGASLPGVPSSVLESALQIQMEHGSAYDQPWGTVRFRKAAAGPYWNLDSATGWGEASIVAVQGGRDGLQKAYAAMIGAKNIGVKEVGAVVIVSAVPWITYNWGPYAAGLNVLCAPGEAADGWRYTPEGIRACVELAKSQGRKVAGIVITSPDNPTGRTIPLEEQTLLAHVALDAGVGFVLFDWIYHWVTDGGPSDINRILRDFTPDERKRLIFLDGLTKSLGASNVRAAHLVAGPEVVAHITSQASHSVIPSFFSQAVAIAAYEMGFAQAAASVIEPTRESRRILRAALEREGAHFVMGDGYYAFIDCTPYLTETVTDSEAVLMHLGKNHGVAVVPGQYFSKAGTNWVRFSYATPPQVTAGAVERLFEGLRALR